MQRKIELTIGNTNGDELSLTGTHNTVHVSMSRPDSGHGMQEEPGADIDMQLTPTMYQELRDALDEVGRAAGWDK